MNTDILNKAYHYLSIRDHSIKEISDKLRKKFETREEIEEVITYLKEHSYLNDLEFAKKYLSYKLANRSCGQLKIKYDLMKKGVSKDIISSVLADQVLAANELETAQELIAKKARVLENLDPLKRKNKAFSYLKNRGFTPDTIYKVLERC